MKNEKRRHHVVFIYPDCAVCKETLTIKNHVGHVFVCVSGTLFI